MLKIKSLRSACKLTQQALADTLEVSRSTIAMWETGESNPNADKLPTLAKILGCSIDDLYNEESA